MILGVSQSPLHARSGRKDLQTSLEIPGMMSHRMLMKREMSRGLPDLLSGLAAPLCGPDPVIAVVSAVQHPSSTENIDQRNSVCPHTSITPILLCCYCMI